MKHKHFYSLFFLLFILLAACNPVSRKLHEAQSIMEEFPDSAFRILNAIEDPLSNLSEKDYALYGLLVTQAKDKCYMDLKNDSIIEISTSYYSHSKDSGNAAMAFLYAGLVAQESNNYTLAVANYLRSKELFPNGKNLKYQFLVREYLASLYVKMYLYEAAIPEYKEALLFADLQKNEYFQAYVLNKLGRTYLGVKPVLPDSTIFYKEQALKISEGKYKTLLPHIYGRLAIAYTDKKEYEKAMDYCDKALEVVEFANFSPDWIYYYKGTIFYELNQPDSALYYLNEIVDTQEANLRIGIYRLIADCYNSTNQYKKSIGYWELHTQLRDSLKLKEEESYKIGIETYVQQKRLKEENSYFRRKSDYHNQQKWILFFIILAGVFAIVIIIIRFRIHRKSQDLRLKQQEIERLQMEKDINERQINEAHLRETYYRQLNLLAIPSIEQDEERKKILTEKNWETLLKNADTVFDGFTTKLRRKYPALTEEDIRYCCLVRMKLKREEMAKMVNITKDGVKKRLQRMRKEKFYIGDGKSWDDIFNEL